MVGIGVAQPQPAQLRRVDDGAQRVHEVIAADDGSRLDENGFDAVEHVSVDSKAAEAADVDGGGDPVDTGRDGGSGCHGRPSSVVVVRSVVVGTAQRSASGRGVLGGGLQPGEGVLHRLA